jgi:hypothetical protein
MFWIFFISLFFTIPALNQVPEEIDARKVIDRVDRILRGKSSHGIASMSIVTDRWQRTKKLEMWSQGTDQFLIRILEPKKEEGVATLKVNSDIWNYLPKIDRTIRIPTSMMMASWMGSHFSNDDLVKESRLVNDYDIKVAFVGPREGVEIYDFLLTPHPDAPVVWGKIEYRVRSDDLMPLWAKYYDEEGALKRTMSFSDFERQSGRLVPMRMILRPEDEPGEYTEIVYESVEFDLDLPKETFSLSSLRRR